MARTKRRWALSFGWLRNPVRVLAVATAIAVYLLLYPIVRADTAASLWGWADAVLVTLYVTLQVFTAGADISGAVETFRHAPDLLTRVHSFYLVTLYAIAPLLAVGFLLTFFQAFSAHLRYWLHRRGEINVFSELNERALALAGSLRHHEPRSVIVFTDVILASNEPSVELIQQARQLGAICFKDDLLELPFHRHGRAVRMRLFVIGSDEEENVWHASSILADARYRERENTDLYLFSDTVEGELALRYRGGKIQVRRINPARSLIYSWLWRDEGEAPAGVDLFRRAITDEQGKSISAAVVGLGGHGREMVQALAWYSQMDEADCSYRLHLEGFDADPNVAGRFSHDYPGLVDGKQRTLAQPRQDAVYDIAIHGGVDATGPEFITRMMALNEQHPLTFVFISLGDDSRNLDIAVQLRRAFARVDAKPQILTISRNSRVILSALKVMDDRLRSEADKARAKGVDATPAPRIQAIGDIKDVYSYDCVIRSDLEMAGLVSHLRWWAVGKGNDADWDAQSQQYWSDEYFYSSSICAPIHWRARRALGIPGARSSDRSEDEKELLSRLEHARWNAFIRSEGFVYGTRKDLDVAKTHPLLVEFDALSKEEQGKDDNDVHDAVRKIEENLRALTGQEGVAVAPTFLARAERLLSEVRPIISQ